MTLPIPEDGLDEVLRSWSGRGELLDALAHQWEPLDDPVGVAWSRADLERRAALVLIHRVTPSLKQWPSRLADWIDVLPAATVRQREVSVAPRAGTSWRETRQRFGWPPTAFAGRSRSRVPDELLVTSLHWTLQATLATAALAASIESTATSQVAAELDAAERLLSVDVVAAASEVRPNRSDIEAMRREGFPWNKVAPVADELRRADESVDFLAREILMPVPGIRDRLFHLGVLGVVLRETQRHGIHWTSRSRIGSQTSGPVYRGTGADGEPWHLWFEAAGVWGYYKRRSPYMRASKHVPGGSKPLSPDILLLNKGGRALILECKYSDDGSYIGRRGIVQTMGYCAEALTEYAGDCTGLVVAPEGVVPESTLVPTAVGRIGVTTPGGLSPLIADVITGA